MRYVYFAVFIGYIFSVTVSAATVTPPNSVKKPVNQWCTPLVNRLPKVTMAQCQNSTLKASGTTSTKGFPLLIKDVVPDSAVTPVTPVTPVKNPIKVLLIGGIHGDEKTASAIVFQWLDKLNKSSGNEFHWKIAPVINPDGLLAIRPTRVNAHGVDLNRNFPTPNWDKEAPQYWRQKTRSDPRRFPGKAALSEPESRWIFNQINQFQPDVIISVHAPFGVLDFDGAGSPPSKFGRLLFNRVGVYPGSLGNYGGLHKDIPVVTIELPNAQQMPSDIETARIWQDMVVWVQNNVSSQTKLAAK